MLLGIVLVNTSPYDSLLLEVQYVYTIRPYGNIDYTDFMGVRTRNHSPSYRRPTIIAWYVNGRFTALETAMQCKRHST
jgi:hypothetical protein